MRLKALPDIIKLLRPQQWYKNGLVYIGGFFGESIFELETFLLLTAGFFCLCGISSVNYIINDLHDLEKDKLHPEKRHRPLPSGKLSKGTAIFAAVVLFTTFSLISIALDVRFAICVLGVFFISQIYSFQLKHVVFADVSLIAINYVLRAVSGCYLAEVRISPWLVLCGFLAALLLALCKRRADLAFLGDNAAQHRPVFQFYSLSLLDQAISISAGMTIISYALYSIEREPGGGLLILSVPLFTFLIFRYIYLLQAQSQIARNPERLFMDYQLLLGGIALIIFFIIRIYLGDMFEPFDIFNPEESFDF